MSDSPPPDYQSAIKSRAPRVGDHVISHHFRHAYYTATILSFNKEDMTYLIQWDDGDPSGRNPRYDQVRPGSSGDWDSNFKLRFHRYLDIIMLLW